MRTSSGFLLFRVLASADPGWSRFFCNIWKCLWFNYGLLIRPPCVFSTAVSCNLCAVSQDSREESVVEIPALICNIGLLFFKEIGVGHQCQKCIQYSVFAPTGIFNFMRSLFSIIWCQPCQIAYELSLSNHKNKVSVGIIT